MIKDVTGAGPPSTSSRSSRFLGCFGYSGEMMSLDDVNSSSRRRNRSRRWISEWNFSCKKSSTKAVHVDFTTVHRKSKPVNEAPANPDTSLTKPRVIMVDASHAPATTDEQKINTRKKWTDIVKRENGSLRTRRKDTKPADTSATGAGVKSTEKKTETVRHPLVSPPLKPLTHSKSLPVIKKQKPPKAPTAGGGVEDGVKHKPPQSGGEFDSIIAMSILLTILVIMVLWGKLCAIFCTSALFFVAPRLVATPDRRSMELHTDRRTNISSKISLMANNTGTTRRGWDGEGSKPLIYPESQNNLNLESVEYKKKVILEGLLQRDHRNVVGRL
ncbi:hypothetical protein E3N88_17077 [Mikania micrantha]|uniref:Uncharacterized protein n=1 Tax=Mikania micrantha TaxID=192012 RepID=A0A5N6NQY0_9ASTR|nr:hypothetical protein E3N88_17077 [Mikania micrantha]